MLFYIAVVDGRPTCFKESEHAFEHVSHSDNCATLARLKKHFAKRSIA
jgi:hypothetical protein